MKKYISIILFILIAIAPAMAYANFATKATAGFGGKVISSTIPIVTCTGFGTGPLILSSSIENLGSAVVSTAGGGGQPTTARVGGVISDIYGAIPFYAKYNFSSTMPFISSTPKAGGWILGKANLIPDFSTCYIPLGEAQIPFPVRDTNTYQVSGGGYTNSL